MRKLNELLRENCELKRENTSLKNENEKLKIELEKFRKMGLWEFAHSLSDEEQIEAGHQLAQSLLGR